MNRIPSMLGAVLASAALLSLAGCASFEFTKAAPAQKQPVALKTSGEELSGWTDLPIGVYRVPDSHVIITGHQKGQVAGLLFGVIGVAIAHAANASAGADAVKNAEQQLRIKLTAPTEQAIRSIVADPKYATYFTSAEQPGAPRLLVTPALVMSFVNEDSLRPYVVLKASLLSGNDPKPVWNTRYIASSGPARPLLGPNGWLENDGAALRQTVQSNLELAMKTMATDVSKPYARDDSQMVMV
jgi:hypothetical protein